MLSFDISDKQINIVKGDNAANRIKIDKSLTLEIPDSEDYILNGEVINLTGLAEFLLTNLNQFAACYGFIGPYQISKSFLYYSKFHVYHFSFSFGLFL